MTLEEERPTRRHKRQTRHLVEELWNQIARESNAVEPPAWHDAVLAEDAQRYAADPSRGDSWENVKRRIVGQG